MKKKIIIISSLIVILAVPVAVFLFLLFTQPLFASKVLELCKIIDLRKNLPEGRFQKVSIVASDFSGKDYEGFVIFEVPADKMAEFEAGFRKCVQNATPLKGILTCLPDELRIQAEKGKYSAYICCDDDVVVIYGGFFHRGFISSELRKGFYNAGLKYTAGGPRERGPKEKEVNEPNYQEILRQSGLKAAEHGRRIKEAKEREKDANQPEQKPVLRE